MKKKLAIHIDILNDTIWNLVFSLFDLCHNKISTFNEENFALLIKMGADIRYHNDIRPIDAVSPYGKTLNYDILCNELKQKTTFFISIVCKKNDDSANNPDIFPFISWVVGIKDVEEKKDISFGIDISDLDETVKGRYKYRLGQKLQLIKDKLPVPSSSDKCLYYIDHNHKTNNKNTYSFPYSKKDGDIPGSRRFLPFLLISETLYNTFSSDETRTGTFIGESINHLNSEMKGIDLSKIKSSSPFEDWFIKAYLCHLKDSKSKGSGLDYDKYEYILHEYYFNIYELVQNIIFHTKDKAGMMSLDFVKKRDIKDDIKLKIPHFDEYGEEDRFLEIELIDYGNKGIVSTFKSEINTEKCKADACKIELKTFFDPFEILPDTNNQLTLRYVAHLGIKTFVSSVINNEGYFYVESNNGKGGKDWLEIRDNKLLGSSKNGIESRPGTRYIVALPVRKKSRPIPQIRSHDNVFDIRQGLNDNVTEIKAQNYDDGTIENKESQVALVVEYGKSIIENISRERASIASVDMSAFSKASPDLLFKIIAYVRLNTQEENQPKITVYHHLQDDVFGIIKGMAINHTLSISEKKQDIWSDEYATVLLSKKLQILILCGTKKRTFLFYKQQIQRVVHQC